MSNNIPDYKDNLYFNSQNTKNEQQKDLCIISEQLTEQMKKGELSEGLYYVENNEGNIGILGWSKFAGWYNIKQVLAPVPTFNELQNMNKAVNECMAANIKLVEENAQLKEQINKCYLDAINRGTANAVKAVKEFGMPERIEELVEENAQLKELLKECKEIFDECFSPSAKHGELYKKIDEVLK